MSALERLENYRAEQHELAGGKFDTKTPEGAFLQLVHNRGYKLYNDDGSYTELYYALTTKGNQKIQAIAGSGKALANDTEVITPFGYVQIEDLKVGDKVLGEDGEFHDVLGVYPQGKKQVYSLQFENTSIVFSCSEHIWTLCNDNEKKFKDRQKDVTTFDIMTSYYNRLSNGNEDDFKSWMKYGMFLDVEPAKETDLDNKSVAMFKEMGITDKLYHLKELKVLDKGDIDIGYKETNELADYVSWCSMPKVYAYKWDDSVIIRDKKRIDEIFNLADSMYIADDAVFLPEEYRLRLLENLCRKGYMLLSQMHKFTDIAVSCGYNTSYTGVSTKKVKNLLKRARYKNLPSEIKEEIFSEDEIVVLDDIFIYSDSIATPLHKTSLTFNGGLNIERLSVETDMTCIAVDNPSHLFVLRGGIATHNTTSLIFKIMHDIVTGEIMKRQSLPNGNVVRVVDKVFVGTFLRSGALELQKKLASWQNGMGYTVTSSQINFGTLHAEFKRCLNTMGVATPMGSASVLNGLLRKAIDSCNITRGGDNLINEDYKIIESVVTYYRGRLDDKRYQHPSAGDYELTPTILDLLVKQYSSLKTSAGVMDFEDLQELLYRYLYVTPNPNVVNFVANRYNYIYLDEFQDTSQIQYAILKVYCRGCIKGTDTPTKGKIVVVGDVQQCIYSFRGSDINVMHKDFDNDFMPTHNSLSYNYRCPSNILKPVVDSIMLNPESGGIKIMSSAEGGTFRALGLRNTTQMLAQLEKDLETDIEAGRSVGVLCRTNYDGMIPALFMEMSGKYHFSISGEGMTLSSTLPRSLIKVAKLFTERSTPAIKTVLKMFVGYRDIWMVNKLCDTLKQNRLSIWNVNLNDLEYSCKPIYDLFSIIRKIKEDSGDLVALRALYIWLMQNKYDGDSAYCEAARSCIEVLIYFIDNKELESVLEFEDELDALNDRLKARIGKNSDIAIATVHEFKGKERDSIYIWNDSENVFPGSKVDLGDMEQVSEERRVHYIACTRARKKCHIYAKLGCEGMFLKEMNCDIEAVVPEIGGKL